MADTAKRNLLRGLLAIGDPHIEGRQPNFRCDDYPKTILNKVRWCLDFASQQQLLPVFLGDVFDKPRDNPTWMLGELIDMMLGSGAIGIYGNHDCAEPVLTDNDSLTILIKAGCLQHVSSTSPWVGQMNGRRTVIGGSSYRQTVPQTFELDKLPRRQLFDDEPLVIWLTHHDVEVGDYEGGRLKPVQIKNVDLVINGHIHTRADNVTMGSTLWMTPGNISRRSRSDAARQQKPAVLTVTVQPPEASCKFETAYVEVPHDEFDNVFHPAMIADQPELGASAFIAGLRELQSIRTQSGAGLQEFLNKNIDQFPEPVAREIMALATQVTQDKQD